MGKISHVRGMLQESTPPDQGWLVETARAMAVLSAMYAPLAVELFSSGVLSALLRVAQRWVAAQPRRRQDGAVTVLKHGLVNVVYAFGLTVPQARARVCLPRAAAQAVFSSLLRSLRCLSACRWRTSIG